MSWQQPYGPPTRESGTAIAALVLGICGFLVCPFVCSVAAVVCAQNAFREIDASGGRITGRGYAQAGNILGWLGLALCMAAALAFAALIMFGANWSLV